jgi:hypothetical protein
MRAMRLAVLALATLFVGYHSAQADDRGRPAQSRGLDSRHDFRRDDFRRRDDFGRGDFRYYPWRFCWCGVDFYRFPGHHHQHDNRRF